MSKHTPGPWMARPTNNNQLTIKGPDGILICSITRNAVQANRADNARLIAASPEMFSAIGDLRSLFTTKFDAIQFGGSESAMKKCADIFKSLEMAYRKAEGRKE